MAENESIQMAMKEHFSFYERVSDTHENHYLLTGVESTAGTINKIKSLVADTYTDEPTLSGNIVEYGPRLTIETSWSTHVKAILKSAGFTIARIEKFVRVPVGTEIKIDTMTHRRYDHPVTEFPAVTTPVETFHVDDIESFNREHSLGMDSEDIAYYTDLFSSLKRSPTDVEIFDLAQSNSEHSRHWFFNGKLKRNGKPLQKTLFEMIKEPLRVAPVDSLAKSAVAFHDNASAIKIKNNFITMLTTECTIPIHPNEITRIQYSGKSVRVPAITFTAETHNFPTGISPFEGAATGIGGRIRDNLSIGRGGRIIAGTAGYCVGNLPWDPSATPTPQTNIPRTPLEILIEASNGASDYGNKIGEPIICGFARSFGHQNFEWIKPIMFTGGLGQVHVANIKKKDLVEQITPHVETVPAFPEPQEVMILAKNVIIAVIGGPAYRIGMGGGSASSQEQGAPSNAFNAVQRGDPQMENGVMRVVRWLSELHEGNPIISIHDQGAGGMANVIKELINPVGGVVRLSHINVADKSMSAREIWVAEYQERVAILIDSSYRRFVRDLANREHVPVEFVGVVCDTSKITVLESDRVCVDLPLEPVMKAPQKEFEITPPNIRLPALKLPKITVAEALERVLPLTSVGSKRFLTNKVDRSVTGLIAQQQCVGPLHTPISNYAIVALDYFTKLGAVTSIGERPIAGLIDTGAMARLALAEAITNMIFARGWKLSSVRCSTNWMWPGKDPTEAWYLHTAMSALVRAMKLLGVAADGGKDSMSMRAGNVKSPRQLVISAYAPCIDITQKITPEFKRAGSTISFIDLAAGTQLGSSALAQAYGQIGNDTPDISDDKFLLLKKLFNEFSQGGNVGIISGHDRSDGGLITTLLEMCFAGNTGCDIDLTSMVSSADDIIPFLFSEGPGLVIEHGATHNDKTSTIINESIPLGQVTDDDTITITYGGQYMLKDKISRLRDIYESSSFRLELQQANPKCVRSEQENMRKTPQYFVPDIISMLTPPHDDISRNVAVVRDEGSNGDREMAAAFYAAGFRVFDITTDDLATEGILNGFSGIAFVGGFSNADTLGAAYGWYCKLIHNSGARRQLERFHARKNTFSLGVCNGCQLLSLLGWVPNCKLVRNESGRFESRFPTVRVEASPSIFLRGLEGLVFGLWVAHGEGRFIVADGNDVAGNDVADDNNNITPVKYVDDEGNPTEKYPYNPNGSRGGIGAICSRDGRHLAIMGHPERSFIKWQLPWQSQESADYLRSSEYSPWFAMFKNAFNWCRNNSSSHLEHTVDSDILSDTPQATIG